MAFSFVQAQPRMGIEATTEMALDTSFEISEKIEVPQIDLRAYFPETWLFDLADLDSFGQQNLEVNAPHSITVALV